MEQNFSNPEEMRNAIELRLRTMRVLWFALCMSIVLYFVFAIYSGRPKDVGSNNALFLALLAIAVAAPVVGLVIRTQLLRRAIEQRQVPMVQQGYIVGWAITESGALLGLLTFFITDSPYYFVFFIVALIAQLLQFPQREHVAGAMSGPK
jgi:hypothetical protein